VTIRDNLSPRERQVAETLAGLREDPAHDFPLEGDPMDLDPLGTPPEAPKLSEVDRARREAQAEREMTAFWICPRCSRRRTAGARSATASAGGSAITTATSR
jgi:hypothetical protein